MTDAMIRPVWLSAEACSIEEFDRVVSEGTHLADYPHAAAVELGAVVYDSAYLRKVMTSPEVTRIVKGEIARALLTGPGIVVFQSAFEPSVVAPVSRVFEQMIVDEKAHGAVASDHYAPAGANDRVWNALEKLALRDPDLFVSYYANDMLALVAEAWLGPAYQVTSQVNVVNPGGRAQSPHRDYHLGFLTDEMAERFPDHVHSLSPVLTLQGAVAHCDMPTETGPTLYLPHSHKYLAGYLAWRRPDFVEYFARHHVQLPLRTGGAVFFSPALFHAAGNNNTADIRRMANLLQVSSAFGRAMESIDRYAMSSVIYPALRRQQKAGLDRALLSNAITACADGYPFPTNLDLDPPIGGLVPRSQADVLNTALDENWPGERLDAALAEHRSRRLTSAP